MTGLLKEILIYDPLISRNGKKHILFQEEMSTHTQSLLY